MNYLLDDYLILYNNTGDKKYLTGALSTLKKCGFDDDTIEYLITWEMDIIKFRKLKDLIVDKSFWINDMKLYKEGKKNSFFTGDFNDYLGIRHDDKSRITKKTLTLSELVLMFDEAWKLSHLYKDIVPENMFKECFKIAEFENNKSPIIFQFRIRIEECYRQTHNVPDIDEFYAKDMITNLYDYEFEIVKNKNMIS